MLLCPLNPPPPRHTHHPLQAISSDQVQKGFSRTLEAVDDLVLDVPDAVEQLANFVARAVVDDILPPCLLSRVHGSEVAGSNLAAILS